MASQWVRASDVVWEELDGEAVLVSTSARKTWVLNSTASFLWKCCDGRISIEKIAARLASAGGREAAKLRLELLSFCQELEQKGLLIAGCGASNLASEEQLPLAFCFASVPPLIKMESARMGIRGRPSPRGVCNGP